MKKTAYLFILLPFPLVLSYLVPWYFPWSEAPIEEVEIHFCFFFVGKQWSVGDKIGAGSNPSPSQIKQRLKLD
jgi:hypothetical protein